MGRLSPVWPFDTGIEAARGQGSYLYTEEGRAYLDFTSGIGVTSTGHCHPRVVAAVQQQAEHLLHGQLTIVRHRPILDLVEELARLLPEDLRSFFFANSGGEAVESALKLARHATGRPNIIAFQGGYHGRTFGALSITTAKSIYRSGYQPLVGGVFVAPFPYALQHGSPDPDRLVDWCLDRLDLLLATASTPDETAAMIVEPVLGEGGYVVAPARFLQGLRQACDRHGIVLIIDEVQTGFGRTGRMFASEHAGIWPDIVVMAKGMASGMPMSAIAASDDLMSRWRPGSHGGTYGGNPVCAAAAVETIRILRDEGLVERAADLGGGLLGKLEELRADVPLLAEVRGLGLMIGCELATPDGDPNPGAARRVRRQCLSDGLLLTTCGPYDQVVRWIPPLTVSQAELDSGFDIFAAALRGLDEHTTHDSVDDHNVHDDRGAVVSRGAA